jgi:3-oxo-5-alpha-steroid 4-dehydrogenase 1
MGIVFNMANAFMQGQWLFYLAPDGMYTPEWLTGPRFIIGLVLFLIGFATNIQSDYIIRHLRKDGDTNHYLPQKGLFRYVTSANYFGEIIEWLGFAVLTWSMSGFFSSCGLLRTWFPVLIQFTADYQNEFSLQMAAEPRKRIFPFIY